MILITALQNLPTFYLALQSEGQDQRPALVVILRPCCSTEMEPTVSSLFIIIAS